MIGLLKNPSSICQSGWKEIRNSFPVIRWVHWGVAQNKDIGAAPQTLLKVMLHGTIRKDDF